MSQSKSSAVSLVYWERKIPILMCRRLESERPAVALTDYRKQRDVGDGGESNRRFRTQTQKCRHEPSRLRRRKTIERSNTFDRKFDSAGMGIESSMYCDPGSRCVFARLSLAKRQHRSAEYLKVALRQGDAFREPDLRFWKHHAGNAAI